MPPYSRDLKIEAAHVWAFEIPTTQPESDGTAKWDSTTAIVVELTCAGTKGIGYSYTNSAAAKAAVALLRKAVLQRNPLDIPCIHDAMDHEARNWGRPGLVSCSIAAIDIALWDLKARLLQVPLADLLGRCRDEVAAYGSGGFTSYSEGELIEQLTGWADAGFQFVKMKVGRDPAADPQRVAAVQRALAGKAELFVDANGAYNRGQAMEKAQQFGDLGVTWFEEPVTSDDRIGLRLIANRAPVQMKIAAGEYTYVLDDARLMIEAQALHVLQTDVTRCGGITNFLKIGHLCETYHLPYSAHTAPSVHTTLCCSLLSAINLEYFYDHVRIEKMMFDGALQAKKGTMTPDRTAPGLGLSLKFADVEKFCVSSEQVA